MFFDLNKEYQTKDGHKVQITTIRIGDAFPLKGEIISSGQKYCGRYMRWTLQGIADATASNIDKWDLVEKGCPRDFTTQILCHS